MTDLNTLAARHARAFARQSRSWTASEFETLLANPHTILIDHSAGFALARLVAGEAELLTIATDPNHRRKGHGRALLSALETALRAAGAMTWFLEVAETNTAARALYAAQGFRETARRKAYYTTPQGAHVDALILSKSL